MVKKQVLYIYIIILLICIVIPSNEKMYVETSSVTRTVSICAPYESAEHQTVLRNQIEQYKSQNDFVDVQLDFYPARDFNKQMVLEYSKNTLPDLIISNNRNFPFLVKQGIVSDLTAYEDLIYSDEIDINDYHKHLLENNIAANGNLYALPYTSYSLALYSNMDMLNSVGYNQPPKTWDELLEICRSLKSYYYYSFGIAGKEDSEMSSQFLGFYFGNGATLDKMNETNSIEVFSIYQKLVSENMLQSECINWNQRDLAIQFTQGNIGFIINSSNQYNFIKNNNKNFDWQVSLLPTNPKNNNNKYLIEGESISLSHEADVQSALSLFKFLQSTDQLEYAALQYGGIPVRQDIANNIVDNLYTIDKIFFDQIKNPASIKSYRLWEDINSTIHTQIYNIIVNKTDAESAAYQAHTDVRDARVSS